MCGRHSSCYYTKKCKNTVRLITQLLRSAHRTWTNWSVPSHAAVLFLIRSFCSLMRQSQSRFKKMHHSSTFFIAFPALSTPAALFSHFPVSHFQLLHICRKHHTRIGHTNTHIPGCAGCIVFSTC